MLKLDVDTEVYAPLTPNWIRPKVWERTRQVLKREAEGNPDPLTHLLPWERDPSEEARAGTQQGVVAAGEWVESVPDDIVAMMLRVIRHACHLSQVRLAQQVGQSEGWYRNREAGTVATTPDDWVRIWGVVSRCERLDLWAACNVINSAIRTASGEQQHQVAMELPENAEAAAAMVEELCGLLTPQELAHVLGLVASVAESRAAQYGVRWDCAESDAVEELEHMLIESRYHKPVGCLRMPGEREENPA